MKRALLLLLLVICFLSTSTVAQETKIIAIKAGKLIDTENGTTINNPVVMIEGERIVKVGSDLEIPNGAEVIDLGSATLLPGLIDCHVHLSGQSGNYYDTFRKSVIDAAVVAPNYAKNTLMAGFTTVRGAGSPEYLDVALKNAINSGTIPGPRMLAAASAIGATGGHGDLVGFAHTLSFTGVTNIADGVDEIRKMVRNNIKYGADVIKIIATAGVLSEEESVGAPQYSYEEMKVAVDEAAMWHKKVMAHAHGTEGIKRAIKAGVASIEHGSLIDDEGIQMMIDKGTYLVADVYVDDYIIEEFTKLGYPDAIIEKERLVGLAQRQNFQKAIKAGVKIAFGTDAGVYPHGMNGKQFRHMVEWGMTPMQAIQAATKNAADLISWTDKVGAVKSGLFADIIAVDGNPLEDVTMLENVSFVMKGGKVYKQ